MHASSRLFDSQKPAGHTVALDQSAHQRLSTSEVENGQQSPSLEGRPSKSRDSREIVRVVKERWHALRGLKENGGNSGSAGSKQSFRLGASSLSLSRSMRSMKNLSSAVGGILDEALQADLGWDDDGGEEGEHVWLILGTARGAAIGLLLSFVHPSVISSLPHFLNPPHPFRLFGLFVCFFSTCHE
jgi:hypothetical protein